MKTVLYLLTGALLTVGNLSSAQTSVAKNLQTITASEDELPAVGVRYYYYPNLDAYYDSQDNLYVYQEQGQWVKKPELASGYRGYSLLNTVRVAITDYNGDSPYTNLKQHQLKFPKQYSSKRRPPKIVKEDAKVAYN